MQRACISGIGVEIPPSVITNEQLVASFNAWVDAENARREGTGATFSPPASLPFTPGGSGWSRAGGAERDMLAV